MTADKRVPTPEQVQAWLRAHGWTPEASLPPDPEDGIDFIYKERSDEGEVIWVNAPRTADSPPWYPLLVQAVVVTAAGMEDRPEADVLAEMLATSVAPAPQAPSVPAA